MKSIGGNITALFQIKDTEAVNEIYEHVPTWMDALSINGWLDYTSGDSKHTDFNAKVQDSTHVFICDYQNLGGITSENSRAVIGGKIYEVLLIDNPMEMNYHYEIYLKFVGGEYVG